uniref:Uncharacterized protein n=1 Tax=Anguilla anguilla TaxID=7936 RepID=A0A0E9QBB6_ANGAN
MWVLALSLALHLCVYRVGKRWRVYGLFQIPAKLKGRFSSWVVILEGGKMFLTFVLNDGVLVQKQL